MFLWPYPNTNLFSDVNQQGLVETNGVFYIPDETRKPLVLQLYLFFCVMNILTGGNASIIIFVPVANFVGVIF